MDFTSPVSIFVINSEYVIFVLALSTIEVNNTTKIIARINQTANVFNLLFNFSSSFKFERRHALSSFYFTDSETYKDNISNYI